MSTALSKRQEWTLLLTLAGIQFTHILDFMVLMPLGPQLVNTLQISNAQFGLLVSAYTFAAGFAGLLASTYIDRFERKRLLLTLYTLFAIATLGCGLARSYEGLIFARTMAGFFGGVLTAMSQTIVADVIPFERRGKAMGVVMTAFSVSTVMGVPLSLLLVAYSTWYTPFLVIAAVSLVLIGLAWFSLPDMRGHLAHSKAAGFFGLLQETLSDSNHWKGFLLTFLLVFASFIIIPYIALYTQINGGVTQQDLPIIYLLGGAATLISAPTIGRLSDQYGKVVVLRWVASIAIFPMILITVSEHFAYAAIFVLATGFFIFVSGRMIPGMALLTGVVNPNLRGTFMTLNSSVQSAAMGLGALIGGALIGRDINGFVTDYWMCGAIGVASNLAAMWLAGKVAMRNSPKST